MILQDSPQGILGKIKLDSKKFIAFEIVNNNLIFVLIMIDNTLQSVWNASRSYERGKYVCCNTDSELIRWKKSYESESTFAYTISPTGSIHCFFLTKCITFRKTVVQKLKSAFGKGSVHKITHFRGRIVAFQSFFEKKRIRFGSPTFPNNV